MEPDALPEPQLGGKRLQRLEVPSAPDHVDLDVDPAVEALTERTQEHVGSLVELLDGPDEDEAVRATAFVGARGAFTKTELGRSPIEQCTA